MPIIYGLILWLIWTILAWLVPNLLGMVLVLFLLHLCIEGWHLFIRQGVPLCIAEGILACWGLFHLNRWLNNEYDQYPTKHEQSVVAPHPQISTTHQRQPKPEFDEFELTDAQKRHIRRLQAAARRAQR